MEDLVEPITEAEILSEQEYDAWSQAGEEFAALVTTIRRIHGIAEQRDALLLQHEVVVASLDDPELKARAEAAFTQPFPQFPASIPAAIEFLFNGCMDPTGEGYREPFGRVHPLGDRLLDTLPDLRNLQGSAQLSGRADAVRGSRQNNGTMQILEAR